MAEEGEGVAATMKDLKALETSLTSKMDKRMDELRELVAKLASVQACTPSTSSIPGDNSSDEIPLENEEAEGGKGKDKEGEGTNENDLPKKPTSSNGKGEKGGYHVVSPPSYTPDPLIPHPHINNIGDVPKIDASSSFSQWQYLMQTYLHNSCNELWRILQKGYKPFNPDNLSRI